MKENWSRFKGDLCVERDNLYSQLIGALEQFAKDPAGSKKIINLIGPAGIGKTWFMKSLPDYLPETIGEMKPAAVYVDLSREGRNPEQVLKHAVMSISASLAERGTPGFEHPDEIKNAKALVARITKTNKTEKYIPVLMFDGAEVAGDDALDKVEDEIIFPLVEEGKSAIMLFASRSQLFFRYIKNRLNRGELEIPPFSLEQTGRQAHLLKGKFAEKFPELPQILQTLSQGLPGLNTLILKALESPQYAGSGWLNNLLSFVGGKIEGYFPWTDKKWLEILWDICVLRRFYTSQIRFFASKKDASFSNSPDGFFLDKIQEMIDNNIARWNQDAGGYMIHPLLVQLMRANLEARAKNQYHKAHQTAIEMYRSWFVKYPENATYYLMEILYHGCHLVRTRGLKKEQFLEQLQEILKEFKEEKGYDFMSEERRGELQKLYEGDTEVRDLMQQVELDINLLSAS